VVLLWDLMQTRNRSGVSAEPGGWVRKVSLGIGLYLLVLASSATAWVAFLIGLPLLFLGKRLAQRTDARRVFMVGAFAIALLLYFGMTYASDFSQAMERGEGFSGRTDIWRMTLEKFGEKYGTSLVGAGYHGFWESSVGESVWKEIGMNPLTQAHNGYIETYLHGGLIGLFLLGVLVVTFGWRAVDKLVRGDPFGRLAVVFWPVLLFVNFTEAQFFQVGPLWFTTLLVTMNGPWGEALHARRESTRGRQWGRRDSINAAACEATLCGAHFSYVRVTEATFASPSAA
jgi:exopolysaccharide production protein ExoQ